MSRQRQTSGYDVAQICFNGHVVNAMAGSRPERNVEFCKACGARTATRCPECRTEIHGTYWRASSYGGATPSGLSAGDPPPAFCHFCGKPYPWTLTRVEAARRLAMEADTLTPEDRDLLSRSLDDLIADTPNTAVAASRVKRILAKVRDEGLAFAFKEVVLPIATETAKRLIWGPVTGV